MHLLVAPRTAVAVATAIVLTGCGSSPTASSSGGENGQSDAAAPAAVETYERINAMSGQERTDELKACAEEEGSLSIYTSNSDIDDLVEGFEETVGVDIEIEVYRATSATIVQRLVQEQRASFYGNDVLETNALELNVGQQEGWFSPYESELRDAVREEGQAEGWTATRFNTFVVGWNTDLVKPGEEPKSFQELAEPKWKGKLSMEISDVDWFAALYQHFIKEGMSEQEALDLFKGIAANSSMAKGHTVQAELLSAGQFAVAVSSYSHTIDKAEAENGAPVAWKSQSGEPVQPLIVRPNGIGLMKTAVNPCAAMLFVDYELTGGQDVFLEAFRVGATEEAAAVIEGFDIISVPEQDLLEDAAKWNSLYEEVTSSSTS